MAYRMISNLTEFSDDILLFMFSYLSSWDLLNILDTCQRFNKVGKDHSLWRKADFSDGSLSAAQMNRSVLPCLQSCTKHIHLKGRKRKFSRLHKWKTDLLTPAILKNIGKKCPDLKEFFISEAIVDAKKLKLVNFGELKELRVLSIVNCEFINLPSPVSEGSYFRNMHSILPKLVCLEISKCNWINDYDLMVLSKLDTLKKLSLKCNLRIGFTIAYLSISFRFGFRNLEELDLRGTSLQNSDVQSVVQSGKLRSLSIGPVGRVKRLSDEGADDGLNLVMSDPRRRDEPRQQVVVINMGPNGPHWRQADEEELDRMGLQWVKNGLSRVRQGERDDEEGHYFFGKEGKIVRGVSSSQAPVEGTSGECSSKDATLKKRKLEEEEGDADDEGEIEEGQAKRPRKEEGEGGRPEEEEVVEVEEEEEEEEEEGGSSTLPDKCLSDLMVHTFKDHARHLRFLTLAGCALSDAGLLELIRHVPALQFLDVSNSHVTPEGLQQARVLLPECRFVGGAAPGLR